MPWAHEGNAKGLGQGNRLQLGVFEGGNLFDLFHDAGGPLCRERRISHPVIHWSIVFPWQNEEGTLCWEEQRQGHKKMPRNWHTLMDSHGTPAPVADKCACSNRGREDANEGDLVEVHANCFAVIRLLLRRAVFADRTWYDSITYCLCLF